MINKSKEFKKNSFNHNRLIFNIILVVYILGLFVGCAFATQNADNLDFVKQITLTQNIILRPEKRILTANKGYLQRDLAILTIVLLLKYSGVLKGVSVCIPFILAVQNSCVYSTLFSEKAVSVFELLFQYILKDTAVTIIMILYVHTTIKEILARREEVPRDLRKLCAYYLGVLCIYIIDYVIKFAVFPGV